MGRRTFICRCAVAAGLALAVLCSLFLFDDSAAGQSPPLTTPPILVTNLQDSGPGSLRQTIADAPAGATIEFDGSLAGGTIVLTSGQLVIDKDLTISGAAAPDLQISGNSTSRVLMVISDTVASLVSLTIRDGKAPDGAPFPLQLPGEPGGGILNNGTLSLSHCVVNDNRSGTGVESEYGEGTAGGPGLSLIHI